MLVGGRGVLSEGERGGGEVNMYYKKWGLNVRCVNTFDTHCSLTTSQSLVQLHSLTLE